MLCSHAGFGAGVTEALVVVTPFEVVKIKLQQQKARFLHSMLRFVLITVAGKNAVLSSKRIRPRAVFKCLRLEYLDGGLL